MDDGFLPLGLDALSHPIRLALYRLLAEAGDAGAGPVALAAAMSLGRPLVSYHLKPLVAAGLATSERRGRDVNYRIAPAALDRLATSVRRLATPAAEPA